MGKEGLVGFVHLEVGKDGDGEYGERGRGDEKEEGMQG